jgi:hypothetical protein
MSEVYESWIGDLKRRQADPRTPLFWQIPPRTRPPAAVAATPRQAVPPCKVCAVPTAQCICPRERG